MIFPTCRKWFGSGLAAWAWLALAIPATADEQPGYAPVRTANPLKGFMPFMGKRGADAFPHSMEFFYLPLKDLMTGPESFTWGALDARLDEIAGRKRHAVFRIYLDYPQHDPGVPDFLRKGSDGMAGTADDLVMRPYDEYGNKGRSLSPDYSDPQLRAALVRFIQAFGARYNGDPRIGFIQIGLLGFWGEWHTFPYSGGRKPEWNASLEVQEEILAAHAKAFSHTRLVVREPKAEFFRKYPIGYHDDSFAYSTLAPPDWHFQGKLIQHGETERWRTQPIGGEVRPEIQPGMWKDPSVVPEGQDFSRCVSTLHASWMLAHGAFVHQLEPAARDLAEKQSRQLGYEFHVSRAEIKPRSSDRATEIRLTLRNTGVAPFYYDWPLELMVIDASGQDSYTVRPEWSLAGLLPGDPDRTWNHSIPAATLPSGNYRLLLRAVNPLDGGLPLRFANTLQDADREGWLSLGSLRIDPSAIAE
jgi:hypothetical protein